MSSQMLLKETVSKARSIWKRATGPIKLKKAARQNHLKIVVGASGFFDPGWTDTDIEYLNLLKPADWERFFSKDTIDAILAEHVWEHLDLSNGLQAAKQCFDYLKPNGYLRIAVPDGFHPDPAYIERVRVGGTGIGADDHKVLYTHVIMQTMLESAGFKVNLLEYFDETGQFHFQEWPENSGVIKRSSRFDARNKDGKLNYTSLIVDAIKVI